jgi:hypothetical protein
VEDPTASLPLLLATTSAGFQQRNSGFTLEMFEKFRLCQKKVLGNLRTARSMKTRAPSLYSLPPYKNPSWPLTQRR